MLLDIGAVLGLICILSAVCAGLFGLRPLIFRSGSMEPSISTGALALSQAVPAGDVKVGDVVSVLNGQNVRVTHRVFAVAPASDGVELTLKGDANQSADAETYTVTSVDRVLLDVPKVGYLVVLLTGPVGILAGGALVITIWSIAFGGRRDPRRGGGARKATAIVLAAVAGLGLSAGQRPTPTLAAFTDSSSMTTGQLAALVVPPPTAAQCTGSAVIGWTSAGPNYSYRVVVARSSDGAVLRTDNTTATSYTVTSTLLGNVVSTNLTVTIRAFPTGTPTWISAGSTSALARMRLAGLGAACGNI